jgi:hypothetical protein
MLGRVEECSSHGGANITQSLRVSHSEWRFCLLYAGSPGSTSPNNSLVKSDQILRSAAVCSTCETSLKEDQPPPKCLTKSNGKPHIAWRWGLSITFNIIVSPTSTCRTLSLLPDVVLYSAHILPNHVPRTFKYSLSSAAVSPPTIFRYVEHTPT